MERALYEIIRLFSFQNDLLTKEPAELVGINKKINRSLSGEPEKNNSIARDKSGYIPTFSFTYYNLELQLYGLVVHYK